MISLATGIAVRDGRLLMVASRYESHADPLWNLPGGRQQPGELLHETVAREFAEETGTLVTAHDLAYVSESYDGERHFLNATFLVTIDGESSPDPADHVVDVAWVPIEEVGQRIVVPVVRDPLVAYLRGALPRRYAGFHEAGITIEWPSDSI
jgi:8-oxo-dGTP diphosphatase